MFNNTAMSQSKTQSMVKMAAKDKHADIYLLGDIGSWWDGNTANDVLYQIRDADLETITVYLSTMGGTFNDGLPIYNLLRNHEAHVTVKVIGYAVSMGGVIMLAGDTIEAAQNAVIMQHEAQGFGFGSKQALRAAADMLETHEKAIVPRFRERMGKTHDEVIELLEKTTWYTADEALEAGLIDAITDPVDLDEADSTIPENSWKFAIENFGEAPEFFLSRAEMALKGKPSLLAQIIKKVVGKPASSSTTETDSKENTMTPEQLAEIKASNTAVVDAVKESNAAVIASNAALGETIVAALSGNTSPPDNSQDDGQADLAEQLRTANEETRAALAKVKELETKNEALAAQPSPNNTYVPESRGAADEEKYNY